MLQWLDQLGVAPESLSPSQRRLVWLSALVVALTRVAALSGSLWDWDEALFSYALRDYDVAAHHPHPPGFPLFIAMAKVIHLAGGSEFRALQTVSLVGAFALFPLMILLGRELRAVFRTAFIAAVLLVFFPNVWFYGGTAFSDVSSLALSLLACVLLLRGCRGGGAYVAGALTLGIAAGFRPQSLLIGLAPAVLATWMRVRITRSVAQPLIAVVVGTLTIASAYGGAAMATGEWAAYRDAVRAHQAYITTVDSFRNPGRPDLASVFDDFFVRPYRMREVNVAISLLAGVALVGALAGKRKTVLAALAIFGPFSVLGWLMLDHFSASRFSVAWAPLIALAASDGLALLAAGTSSVLRHPRTGQVVEVGLAVSLVVTMIGWMHSSLAVVRRMASPPVQAIAWIRANLPLDTPIYVHPSMGPFSELLLHDYRREPTGEEPPIATSDRNAWIIREGLSSARGARNFYYPRRRLWQLVRQRYFETSVAPVASQVRFGNGWHDEESSDRQVWRWMGARGSVLFPPADGNVRLSLRFYVPLDVMPSPASVTIFIALNGRTVDQFVATQDTIERNYDVPARPTGPNELVIGTNRIVNPAKQGIGGDARDLGLRLDSILWSPQGVGALP